MLGIGAYRRQDRPSEAARGPSFLLSLPARETARFDMETGARANMVKGARKDSGGRGSAEAIEKRRVARQLNTLFGGGSGGSGKLDGRTEKRRLRLLKELKEGRGGKELKPIEIITHANELLEMGETLSSIRKNGVRAPKVELADSPERAETVMRAQEAYGFRAEVWKILGIDLDEIMAESDAAKGVATKRKRKT
jgi:hypothetical protein